ncbi:uncharacterized protein BXZ73DRAFT_103314 [Epithele typhae]|uniref:uncharacterized protein n=1 Tax=Epithele typhae TaxID=378194 RepID=UPI0020084E90|nr:uncharacterized protein BXZ73DRAFT_103314 [Epithele typhae]KAH9925438.1 hypothetical protein BXZ73DRAFT_103314 [Epithele typhae]
MAPLQTKNPYREQPFECGIPDVPEHLKDETAVYGYLVEPSACALVSSTPELMAYDPELSSDPEFSTEDAIRLAAQDAGISTIGLGIYYTDWHDASKRGCDIQRQIVFAINSYNGRESWLDDVRPLTGSLEVFKQRLGLEGDPEWMRTADSRYPFEYGREPKVEYVDKGVRQSPRS